MAENPGSLLNLMLGDMDNICFSDLENLPGNVIFHWEV
jgi:hypothetical protein